MVDLRRKRYVFAGIAVLALLLLVVLPGFLASRPAFFGRVPSLTKKYEAWSTSTHVGAGCEGCHVAPNAVAKTTYRARMVGEFYLSLVFRSREPKVFNTPTNESCLACHNDLRTVSPKGDLQIPHRAHVTVLKMKCVECHNYVVHDKSPEGKHTPPMSGCLRCHDGDTAKNGCTVCHTAKAVPASHKAADWDIVHAKKAADPECDSCHKWTENWCVDCHARRPRSHTADWRATHGAQVAKHRSCEACHDAAFCVNCHGELPAKNLDPTLVIVK
jgi:hypothetical protein